MKVIIHELNQLLKGWFEYFKHCRKVTFHSLDPWIRRRLRSILRRRRKGKGISKGRDHNRWPNQYFRECGLFFLKDAYISLFQPRQG